MFFVRQIHLRSRKQVRISQADQEEIDLFFVLHDEIGERSVSRNLTKRTMKFSSRTKRLMDRLIS